MDSVFDFPNIIYLSAFTPYGDVHMFRMQLWSAQLQTWEESFRYPGTLETTQRIKEMCWSVQYSRCSYYFYDI